MVLVVASDSARSSGSFCLAMKRVWFGKNNGSRSSRGTRSFFLIDLKKHKQR